MQLDQPPRRSDIGSIVIGRNEGERLVRCLKSLALCGALIYVDSGSTDGSAKAAVSLGADVILLDQQLPFTAARARNAGLARLRASHPDLPYVQFIDGDCEVIPGWPETAIEFLSEHDEVAAVCGRRIERFPAASIYNALCDREWNAPVGKTMACGGDSVMRVTAIDAVGGFSEAQIAHEEPELCGRLRKVGWTIWRLDVPMTLHDAAIYRIGQFYKRNRRAGFGISQCLVQSGCDIDPEGRTIIRRALFWAVVLPLVILVASLAWKPFAMFTLFAYPLQITRHAFSERDGMETNFRHRYQIATLMMFSKFAEAHGMIEFVVKRIMQKELRAIYYK